MNAPIPRETGIVSGKIVDAALAVHRELGPGLLESVYESCLCFELRQRGLEVEVQVVVPIFYRGVKMDADLRLDLIVGRTVVVEVKATNGIIPVYSAQLMTYLKLTGLRVGLLLNFNVPLLRDGIKRIVL